MKIEELNALIEMVNLAESCGPCLDGGDDPSDEQQAENVIESKRFFGRVETSKTALRRELKKKGYTVPAWEQK